MAKNSNEDLKKICSVLSVPYVLVNEEIDGSNQLRIIDEEEKRFLGVFTMEQALLKARSLNKDIVLVNTKVSPPLCKLTYHRKNLYEKFVREVILNDKEGLTRKKRVKPKVVQLKPKMNINDVRTKLNQLVDLAGRGEALEGVDLCG